MGLTYMQCCHHGLYGSTRCCISHGPSQWELTIFSTPHIFETAQPIFDFHETWSSLCNYVLNLTVTVNLNTLLVLWCAAIWRNKISWLSILYRLTLLCECVGYMWSVNYHWLMFNVREILSDIGPLVELNGKFVHCLDLNERPSLLT